MATYPLPSWGSPNQGPNQKVPPYPLPSWGSPKQGQTQKGCRTPALRGADIRAKWLYSPYCLRVPNVGRKQGFFIIFCYLDGKTVFTKIFYLVGKKFY